MTRLLMLFAAALLAGCATTSPPLTAVHPASPGAAEGAPLPRQTSLRADDATRKSHSLLSSALKDQEYWDAYGPVSGSPEKAPKTNIMPEMKHDQH